jgi:hypothetical protein
MEGHRQVQGWAIDVMSGSMGLVYVATRRTTGAALPAGTDWQPGLGVPSSEDFSTEQQGRTRKYNTAR